MKRIYRIVLAVILTTVMMTLAVGVWAGGREIGGTVPNGTNCSAGAPIIFADSDQKTSCKPALKNIDPGMGKFYSPIYVVEPGGEYVCFAYPPAFAQHNVGIYFYNGSSWEVARYVIVGDPAQICATLPAWSPFALIGNKK